MEFLSLLSNS